MPDEARDGRNVAFELSSDLLVCSIVQRNHSTIFASSHKDMTICTFASFATYHIAGKFDRDFNLRVWQSPR